MNQSLKIINLMSQKFMLINGREQMYDEVFKPPVNGQSIKFSLSHFCGILILANSLTVG